MTIGNRSVIRKVNQRAIVDYIIKNNGASRAEIAKSLSLSKPATSENVADLIERGILSENGIAQSNVGKKATLLKLNYESYYVFVIDFTGQLFENCISVSICDLYYNIICKSSIKLPININRETILQNIDEFILVNNVNMEKVVAIVVSASGIIKDSNQQNLYAENSFPISVKDELTKHYDKDVFVYNDINLAAVGEQQFEDEYQENNLAYLWFDMAIGCGIILNGKLYEGTLGASGEVGLLKTAMLDKEKNISYKFISEVASISAVNKKINREYKDSPYLQKEYSLKKMLSFIDLISGKQLGDKYCLEVCKTLYRCVAEVVYNLAISLDLKTVIIGGHINMLGEDLYSYVREYLKTVPYNQTKIKKASQNDSSIKGAYYIGVKKAIEKII